MPERPATTGAATLSPEARGASGDSAERSRDLRIDFFRGLALIFIFIDHMAGNSLMHLTMRAFGLSDAAEVFVLIAGYSAVLAYASPLQREGLRVGARRIFRRVRDLYVAHVILVAVSALFLATVARYFENPLYFEYVNLTPLSFDPWGAIWRFLILLYQPGYLNILPLYIALLAAFPLIWWGLQRNAYGTLLASGGVWLASATWSINLPSWPEVYGWYFNPLAWQFLFTIGAFAAVRARRGAALSRHPLLIAGAILYLAVGLIVAAPWINIPYLELPRLVPYDALGYVSKTYLSAWRLGHVLAVAYLTVLLVPATARWLRSRLAQPIINCGRNSLDIFCVGTVLSFCGFAVLLEAGRTWEFQVLVNVVGIGVMFAVATWATHRKALQAARTAGTATRLANSAQVLPNEAR